MHASEDVVRTIEALLERERRVNFHEHPLKIGLELDGAVTLEGELENIAAKKLTLRLVAAVPGVTGIVDRLRVAPSTPMSDGEIRDRVRDALLEEPALDNCEIRLMDSGRLENIRGPRAAMQRCVIDVTVDEGVVTLDGQVSSLSQKRIAGVLAWWVPGTRDVVNGIEVAPLEQDNDDEIADAVKLVLEKDPLVNAYRIRVAVHNSEVTLEGLAVNQAESEMAEMDAWYVFGVDRVINQLEHER